MSRKIVAKQDRFTPTKMQWAIFIADGIGAIVWPAKCTTKRWERPTEKQVRRYFTGDYPIEYQNINGEPI